MNDQPVPYPTLGAAYPTTAKPVTPPVVAAPIPAAVAEAPIEAPAEPKFFPLVPTSSSKYVAPEQNDVWASIDAVAEEIPLEELPPISFDEPEIEQAAVPDEVADVIDPQEFDVHTPTGEVSASEFDISSSLNREPQTHSIVLDEVPDVLLTGEIVTDSGEILKTGSIELPSITGEISIISESRAADKADAVDSANLGHSTVAPVRAPAVVNSQARIGALPSKHRRTSGQLMAMLTLAVLIVTVGSLYVMASVLGVIK